MGKTLVKLLIWVSGTKNSDELWPGVENLCCSLGPHNLTVSIEVYLIYIDACEQGDS
jgi:hypothetical protein